MRTGAPRCGGAKRNDHLLLHVRAHEGRLGHESTDFTALCGPVSVGGKLGLLMGARTRTRAKLNVRPRPLVVNATGAVQKNKTPVDPKPRTHKTGNHANPQMLSTLPQSNSQRSNAHCSMLSATFSSKLPCSSLSSFTSLPSLLPSA